MFGFVWYLLEYVIRVWRFIARTVTGKSTMERVLLASGISLKEKIQRIEQLILNSKQLKHVLSNNDNNSTCMYISNEYKSATDLAKVIVERKKFKTTAAQDQLRIVLVHLLRVNASINILRSTVAERYDTENDSHEKLLERLWSLFKPNEKRAGGRITKEWQEIGFQGSDPATDFRAMGILGLKNLVYLGEAHQQQAIKALTDASHPQYWYPFAIAGINFTKTLYSVSCFLFSILWALTGWKFTCQYKLNQYFYDASTSDETLLQFNKLYARVFLTIFHKHWVDKKFMVTDFERVKKELENGVILNALSS